ncbi:sugar transferase, partial [Xanthomonas citri pv. citri]|nr:sugar transferase [Xanthomonas citri pv. citri]
MRSRILIFGTGVAARTVGNTLRASDPHAQIVGFYAGPNEDQPEVPRDEIINDGATLTEAALKLNVDEI